jgi:BirA family transcriptional regulator, biotin operon repressor / biotin---[acetyl-CoA-carboxylase] ligase
MSEPIPSDLAVALEATTARRGVIGRDALYFSETGSTNDVAARLADAGAPEGTVVIAAAQTAGRGRLGRDWFSPPDAGLYVSIVCRDRRAAPFLTLAAGVAVAEGIRAATALPVEIKWPNDIVVPASLPLRRRKVAGVLAEASTASDGLQHVILGFGINLRATAYPAAIADRATSLEAELGRPVDAGPVLAESLAFLSAHMSSLSSGSPDRVLSRWRELAPSSCGSRVEYDGPSGRRVGVTAGIDDAGALLIKSGQHVDRVIAGELVWR